MPLCIGVTLPDRPLAVSSGVKETFIIMVSPIESAEQYAAEEKELAKQAKKYLEDHDCWLSFNFDKDNLPSKEVQAFLFGMSECEDALVDFEDDLSEKLIEAIKTEYLDEETEA